MAVADVKKVAEKNTPRRIGAAVENLLKTDRLVTQSGLDLLQRARMTVMVERLKLLHFISHFRAVHRGAAFAGLRTTSILGIFMSCSHTRWRAMWAAEPYDFFLPVTQFLKMML